MKSILRTYLDIDLNRSYDKGGLLFYASSLTLLMQGRKKLIPFRRLLKAGADPQTRHSFRLAPEKYSRFQDPLREGVLSEYLWDLRSALYLPKRPAWLDLASEREIEIARVSIGEIIALLPPWPTAARVLLTNSQKPLGAASFDPVPKDGQPGETPKARVSPFAPVAQYPTSKLN
jgi:hypothetical protein